MKALLPFIVLAFLLSAPAWAETGSGVYEESGVAPIIEAELAHDADTASHGENHGKGGLPQFDPKWYASQVFWLLVSFAFLYFYFSTRTLPDISSVLQNRKNHIQSDIETAERLQAEAEAVQASYERTLDVARANAAQAITEVETGIRIKAEEESAAFQKRAEKKMQDIDIRIDAVKVEALSNMNDIAAEVASHAVKKIIGVQSDRDHVKSIVDSLTEKARAA